MEAAKALTLSIAEDIQVLGNHVNTLRATSALIEAGDMDGYRRLCASLSDAVASVRSSTPATCLARAGLLLPETGIALDECSRLADFAVANGKDSNLVALVSGDAGAERIPLWPV